MRPIALRAASVLALLVISWLPARAAIAGPTVGERPSVRRALVEVTGRIVDRRGTPVAIATVSIPELGRAATTGSDGRFRFAGIPSGKYTVAARRLGYLAAAKQIVVADSPVDVSLTLMDGALRIEPVNVTAARTPIDPLASPLQTSVLTGDQVHPEGGISLAHAVAQLPGVRSVTSGQQIGKPMLRGLFGPRVLVLTDGSRVEDYSWSDEDGPSIDARLAQRIELIRGPASVLYGSEAIGGVVNVLPGELPYSADGSSMRRQAIEAYGGSNNVELGGAAMVEGAKSRYGWRALGTGRFSLNYQTPAGEVQNSSFWAFNGEGAFGIRGDHGNTTIRAAHYGGEFHLLEASGPEPGDTEGGPVRQTLDDRVQVTNDYAVGGMRLETKGQWQRHSLVEVSDDCQPAPGQTTCQKVKDQQAFGLVLNTGTLDVVAHHGGGGYLSGAVGISGMYQLSSTSGPIFLVPSATTTSLSAFGFEQATFGVLSVVAGLRADARSLSSDATPQLSLAADDRSWSETSGDIGLVLRPVSQLAFVVNGGTGWRAPTLFDLYTNGPNTADARFEIGDQTLRNERSHNVDGGVRWASSRVRADVSVYQNTFDRFIYLAPTNQSINGLRVFRHTQTEARLRGAEVSTAIEVAEPLIVHASYDFVNGDDTKNNRPLPLMPPPRTIVGADLRSSHLGWAHRASIGAEIEVNQTQTRLDPNDFQTEGYTLLNINASVERVERSRPYRFDISVRNATNVSYRDFLSRYKEFALGPGVNFIFKVSTGMW
jgi:outer membrane receptor protein involved in Fe transport